MVGRHVVEQSVYTDSVLVKIHHFSYLGRSEAVWPLKSVTVNRKL